MKWYQFFLVFTLLLFCGLHPQCQQKQNYVYQDTAILHPDEQEVTATNPEENIESSDGQSTIIYADTSLVNNQLVLSADSVRLIKNDKSFAYAKVLDSLLKDYQDRKKVKYKEEPSSLDIFFAAELTKIFFWVAAVAFIAFIVYKLFFTKGFFQRQTAKSNVTVLNEDEKDLSANTDYDSLVLRAVTNNNYRLAVRYQYLRALQKLAAAGAINFSVDKTNAAYIRELSGKSYKNEFTSLTLHYEYIWYGAFAIDEAAYTKLAARFKQLNSIY